MSSGESGHPGTLTPAPPQAGARHGTEEPEPVPAAWEAGGSSPFRSWLRQTTSKTLHGENAGLLVIVLVAFVGIFAIVLNHTSFFSTTNLVSIVNTTCADSVMAVPLVFVICAGEIDLSFAYVIPVAAYVAAILMPTHGVVIAVLAALGLGFGVGLINGIVTVGLNIPSFVVTLGMLGFLSGYAEVIANDATLSVSNRAYIRIFGQGHVGPISVTVFWTLGAVLLGVYVLGYTRAGRQVLATGGNAAAARFSGIKTKRVRVLVFIFAGLGGALGGLIYLGQYTTATATLGGSSDLLNVLAAVIIGGTALTGGRGSVVGALVGSLLLGVIGNALVILGVSSPEELMAEGAIIIATVVISSRRGSRRGGQSGVAQSIAHFVRRGRPQELQARP
ncbi:MAG TPA: ABC transporter permease [Acidimicrobiales bacterium]|nr:ABC transporter permease [Acidimicrobiales bacterium]